MPQASEELRSTIVKRFGSIDDSPIDYWLQEKGWTLNEDWTWSKSGITDLESIPEDEWECILFLRHEWDYGTVRLNKEGNQFMPAKPKAVTLAPTTKPNQKANPQWRTVRVLIEVPAQSTVTDKSVVAWVADAIELQQFDSPIQDRVAPARCGNPTVKSYSRWQQARKTQARNEFNRKPAPPPEGTTSKLGA